MSKPKYTPLGDLYYGVEEWKRKKILHELEIQRIPYATIRTYFTRVKGFRVPADVQKIILNTLPEAEKCFMRPVAEPIEN